MNRAAGIGAVVAAVVGAARTEADQPTYGGHCGRQVQCPGKCGCGEEVKRDTEGDGR